MGNIVVKGTVTVENMTTGIDTTIDVSITEDRYSDYLNLEVRVCAYDVKNKGVIWNPPSYFYSENQKDDFDGLTLKSTSRDGVFSHAYPVSDPKSEMTLDSMERKLKTLRKVSRYMGKESDKIGGFSAIHEHILAFARAIKAKRFLIRSPLEPMADKSGIVCLPIQSNERLLRRLIEKEVKELNKAKSLVA